MLYNGLSPRVRGNHHIQQGVEDQTGSIPACTGEPNYAAVRGTLAAVYPRVYGGTPAEVAERDAVTGLSPRVRGNQRPFAPTELTVGSIPACTGEPADDCLASTQAQVYPRVYGGTTEHPIPACTGEPTCVK